MTIANNDTLSVSGDCSIHIKGNLAFKVDGAGQSSSPIKSSMGITGSYNMTASDSVNIKAPNNIKLECGGSSISIEPGKITITAGGKALIVLDANVLAKSNDGAKVVLDANALTQSSGGSKLVLDANALTQSSGGAKVVLDSNAAVKGGTVKIN